MNGNRFGRIFQLTTFGESHGPAMGMVLEGCPAGVIWRQDLMNEELRRRKPGGALTSGRQEPDEAEILSGVFDGRTLGTPIAAVIRNRDARSQDYTSDVLAQRRGHATDLWQEKYGHSDPRGSGRASGRETVSRVLGGSIARMFAEQTFPELQVKAWASNIGHLHLQGDDKEFLSQVEALLSRAKESGESYGGTICVQIIGAPKGLGLPVFGKLKADLAAAYMSVGAVTGVEMGEGFASATRSGQDFHTSEQDYGGLRGGISTGDPILFKVAFKPTSSRQEIAKQGRHDPCIVPRAMPVMEAMTWLVLADHILLARLDRQDFKPLR